MDIDDMGLIAISGEPGCRFEEIGRITAQSLRFELVAQSRLAALIEQEFGGDPIPARAYADVVSFIVARLATEHHLLFSAEGAESLFRYFPGMLRVLVVAPEQVRVGNLMLDRRLERPAARQLLRELETRQSAERKRRLGRSTVPPDWFDLVANTQSLACDQIVELIRNAVHSLGLVERGFLSVSAEAQIQFQIRLRLARHGIVPPGKVGLPRKTFVHPSEQIFANLLDFYRIPWEYEPRSFPIRWNGDGKVLESFTPDFYLPEFDLYVELTTMKQSLVTRKNRKVRLLRELYPDINIQVFYQKDFENLVFKYGLGRSLAKA